MTVSSALTSSAATVRLPGCAAQPAKGPPWYSRINFVCGLLTLASSHERLSYLSDELEIDHLGGVRRTRAELEDPGVAARTLLVARGDLLEELVDHALVRVLEDRRRLPARVQVALARERDQLLDLRLDRLGLGLGGLDPLVIDDLDAEVGEQRLAVRGVAGQLVTRFLMAHDLGSADRGGVEAISHLISPCAASGPAARGSR